MGMGVSVRVIEEGVPPTPPPITPAGIIDWLKKYWPYLTIGGLGTGLVIAVTKRKK